MRTLTKKAAKLGSQAHYVDEYGGCNAAIVTGVNDAGRSNVSMHVFARTGATWHPPGVDYNSEVFAGTWHWEEDCGRTH